MIHDAVLTIASVWLLVLLVVGVALVLRARSPFSRILALDTMVLVLVALLAAFGAARDSSFLLDAALALAALSFAGTVALARLQGEDHRFR